MFWVMTAGTLPARYRLASARCPRPGRASPNWSAMAKRRRQDSLRASWLARNSSYGIGLFLVHNPPGERKSGMPHSVEMPAPVNGTMIPALWIKSWRWDLAVSRSGAIIVPTLGASTLGASTLWRKDILTRTDGGPTMRYLHTM